MAAVCAAAGAADAGGVAAGRPEARRLGQSGHFEAVGPLSDWLGQSEAAADRAAIAEALGRIGGPEAMAAVAGAADDPEPAVRAAVVAAAAANADDPAARDLLPRLLTDADPQIRAAALDALVAARAEAWAARMLREGLKSSDAALRVRTVEALATTPAPHGPWGLADALQDADPAVRLAAVRAIAQRGGQVAFDLLARAVDDGDLQVATLAVDAVQAVAADVLAQATALARDDKTPLDQRVQAARLLRIVGGVDVIEPALALCDFDTKRAHGDAAQMQALHDHTVAALASAGEAAIAPLVRAVILHERHGRAEKAAADALVRIGPAAAGPVAETLMQWTVFPDPAELGLWVDVLGQIGDASAAAPLQRALAQAIPGMDRRVAEAKAAIEGRTGRSLGALTPEPGLLVGPVDPAACRLTARRPLDVTPLNPAATALPDEGVVRITLDGGLRLNNTPDARGQWDLPLELLRRDGQWLERFEADQPRFSKRSHEGRVVERSGSGDSQRLKVEVVFHDDFWRKCAFGEYTIDLQRRDGRWSARYEGHCNYEAVSGEATVGAWAADLTANPLPPPSDQERPRLLFRRADLEALRARARTPLGQAIVLAIRQRVARSKHLYREPLNYVTTWEPGMDVIIGHGILASLFDDGLHGTRMEPLLTARTRTAPYGGEHGERVPGPMSLYAFGYDLALPYLSDDARRAVRDEAAMLKHMFSPDRGPMGVFAVTRGTFGIPGNSCLAALNQAGPFAIPEPQPPAPLVELPAPAGLKADACPVAHTVEPGRLLVEWVAFGPVPQYGGDPLKDLGGTDGFTIGPDAALTYAGKRYAAWRLGTDHLTRLGEGDEAGGFLTLPACPDGYRFLLCALLDVPRPMSVAVPTSLSTMNAPVRLTIDGKVAEPGSTLVLGKGLHRAVLETPGRTLMVRFRPASADYLRAEWQRYRRLHAAWEQARDRHAATGIRQDVPVMLGFCNTGLRTHLLQMAGEADPRDKSGRPRGGKDLGQWQWPFVASHWIVTGRGLWPDTPMPGFEGVEGFNPRPISDRALCFALSIAPPPYRKALKDEFDRRFLPNGLSRLGCLELGAALVHYPLDE